MDVSLLKERFKAIKQETVDLSKLTILRKGNFRATNFGEYILEGAFRIHPPTNKELFSSDLFNEK